MASASYRVSDGSENPQDGTDNDKDHPDGPQNGDAGDESDDKQNDSEEDHVVPQSLDLGRARGESTETQGRPGKCPVTHASRIPPYGRCMGFTVTSRISGRGQRPHIRASRRWQPVSSPVLTPKRVAAETGWRFLVLAATLWVLMRVIGAVRLVATSPTA